MTIHRILDDKVRLYRRADGGNWHCSTFIDGHEYRKSTKQKNLDRAKDVATDWYAELCDSLGLKPRVGKTFADAASAFEREYGAITQGRRSSSSVQGHKGRLRLHLTPYFGSMLLSEITSGTVQDYRAHRLTEPGHDSKGEDGKDAGGAAKPWKPPARNTIYNEIVTLRMVLKTAQRHGWIEKIPDLSDPYEAKTRAEPRPWFTPDEFAALCDATRRNAARPKNGRYRWHAEQLHDFVLFMARTGLRPDEANLLEYRNVTIVDDDGSGARINGTPYNGINVLMLWASAVERGFAAPIWMTFKQAQELGGHVRKGEKGSLVVYANTISRTEIDADTGEEEARDIPFMKGYTCFNVEQIEGLPVHYYAVAEPQLDPVERIERAENFFAATRADIRHGGNQAYYAMRAVPHTVFLSAGDSPAGAGLGFRTVGDRRIPSNPRSNRIFSVTYALPSTFPASYRQKKALKPLMVSRPCLVAGRGFEPLTFRL